MGVGGELLLAVAWQRGVFGDDTDAEQRWDRRFAERGAGGISERMILY